jgi:Cu-Zn family superoxide dismutase
MSSVYRLIKIYATAACLSAILLICSGWQAIALAATGQAMIQGTSESSDITGVVTLQDTDAGLLIEANLESGAIADHGFHIHEFGSCGDAGNGAGGHYNPDGVKHGKLITDGFAKAHAGDLGNISFTNGAASYHETFPGLSLTGGKYAVAGHALIVHEKADDFGQPTGNAGGRIGCGAIVLAAPRGGS